MGVTKSQARLSDCHFHSGRQGALSRAPCALWWDFTSYCIMHRISSVYRSVSISQLIPLTHFPSLYPYICSPCLCLYFCFASKILHTRFFRSPYTCSCMTFVFLFLTYFSLCMTDSRSKVTWFQYNLRGGWYPCPEKEIIFYFGKCQSCFLKAVTVVQR